MNPGLKAQIEAMNRTIKGCVGEGSYQGIIKLAVSVLGEGQRNAPRDTGNLMGSGFVVAGRKMSTKQVRKPVPKRPSPEPESIDLAQQQVDAFVGARYDPVAVVAFGASYAEIVHEGDPALNWHDGGPKFLEKSVASHIPRARGIVEAEIRKRLP